MADLSRRMVSRSLSVASGWGALAVACRPRRARAPGRGSGSRDRRRGDADQHRGAPDRGRRRQEHRALQDFAPRRRELRRGAPPRQRPPALAGLLVRLRYHRRLTRAVRDHPPVGANGCARVSTLGLADAAGEADLVLSLKPSGSALLAPSARGAAPGCPVLLLEDTPIHRRLPRTRTLDFLTGRLSPQRAFHAATCSRSSGRRTNRSERPECQGGAGGARPAPQVAEVACDHVPFFSSDPGRRALMEALQWA